MPPRVYEIVRGERAVSALRLGRYFGTGPEFWLNLHSHHDLEVARDRAVEKAGDKAALAGVAGAEIALWQARIKERYGTGVSDIVDGNLVNIFERISG